MLPLHSAAAIVLFSVFTLQGACPSWSLYSIASMKFTAYSQRIQQKASPVFPWKDVVKIWCNRDKSQPKFWCIGDFAKSKSLQDASIQ